jgi:hypothetical protein
MDHTMRSRYLILALLIGPLAAALGCGGRGNNLWVTGKLLKGGNKYIPPEGQLVYVTFVGLDIKDENGKPIEGGEPFQADVDQASGTFSVPGKEGYGIPPGKYRIAVTQKMTRETYDATKKPNQRPKPGPGREIDTLGDKFGIDKSPITREIKASGEQIIDMDQPTQG